MENGYMSIFRIYHPVGGEPRAKKGERKRFFSPFLLFRFFSIFKKVEQNRIFIKC